MSWLGRKVLAKKLNTNGLYTTGLGLIVLINHFKLKIMHQFTSRHDNFLILVVLLRKRR